MSKANKNKLSMKNNNEKNSQNKKSSDNVDEFCEIIIMDDEKEVLKIVKEMFRYFKIKVIDTTCGEEVLEIIKERYENGACIPPVLLDLMNKVGMDGIETAERIKHLCPDAILIAMSGYAPNKYIVNYEKYGFKHAITKPFGLKEIKYIIDYFLKKK